MSNVKTVRAEFCVIGGGVGAYCAAIAAARHGVRTVLIREDGEFSPVTAAMCGGLGEEIALACRHAADCADAFAQFAAREKKLTVLTAAFDGTETDGARILSVRAVDGDGAVAVYADSFALPESPQAGETGERGEIHALIGDEISEQTLPAEDEFSRVVAFRIRETDGTPCGVSFDELYARKAENLYCLGEPSDARDAAHDAVLGQAIGTAAAIGVKYRTTPRGVGENHMRELQETLLYDDAFLPHIRRTVSEAALSAELGCDDTVSGDILNLRTGIDRSSPIYGAGDQGFTAAIGASVEYHMDEAVDVTRARIVFDADGDALAKVYALEVESDGQWEGILFENENTRRLVTAAICRPITGIRLTVMETWGAQNVHIFAFDFE